MTMQVQDKGAVPVQLRVSPPNGSAASFAPRDADGQAYGPTRWIARQNEGAVPVRVAWSAAQMAAGHYFTLFANTDTAGRDRWQGPIALGDQALKDAVVLYGNGAAASVCITFFVRQG